MTLSLRVSSAAFVREGKSGASITRVLNAHWVLLGTR